MDPASLTTVSLSNRLAEDYLYKHFEYLSDAPYQEQEMGVLVPPCARSTAACPMLRTAWIHPQSGLQPLGLRTQPQ